jgi:hypothetical protein
LFSEGGTGEEGKVFVLGNASGRNGFYHNQVLAREGQRSKMVVMVIGEEGLWGKWKEIELTSDSIRYWIRQVNVCEEKVTNGICRRL